MSNFKVNICLEISHPECELLFKIFTNDYCGLISQISKRSGLEISHPKYELLFFRNTAVIFK